VTLTMVLCFAKVVQESEKLTLGRKDETRAIEGTGRVPTGRGVSSSAIDKLCLTHTLF